MHRSFLVATLLAVALAGAAAAEPPRVVDTKHAALNVETVASGIAHPWAIDFLPDGAMLVTARPGTLYHIPAGGGERTEVEGVPEVWNREQGGLLDVALHPAFGENRLVYFSFARPEGGEASTALARGEYRDGALSNVEVLWHQEPLIANGLHFGGRIAFDGEGHVFLTLGERFQYEPAQDTSNTLGTVVRLNEDGSVPQDNPFAGEASGEEAIWTFGHRNIEAAAIHPATGALWVVEMGPHGGDEVNVLEPGANYGWPEVSWGEHYPFARGGGDIPDHDTTDAFTDPIFFWNPVISPSGAVFYEADRVPEWRGNLFVGGLSSHEVVRLTVSEDEVLSEERFDMGARVRDVAVGPDGALYVLTDQQRGDVLRLVPMDRDET